MLYKLNKMSAKYAFITLTMIIMISDNTIFDFNKNSNMTNWRIIDDGVMGGLSQGSMILNIEGHAVYSGFVTTENNGGFSSVRYNFETKDVSKYNYVVLRIKGDGKPYQFRIKQNRYDRHSYINYFDTTGEWQEIKIPLDSFYPSFRGYKLDIPNFESDSIEEIAFLIGNKKKEDFKLIIDSITLE